MMARQKTSTREHQTEGTETAVAPVQDGPAVDNSVALAQLAAQGPAHDLEAPGEESGESVDGEGGFAWARPLPEDDLADSSDPTDARAAPPSAPSVPVDPEAADDGPGGSLGDLMDAAEEGQESPLPYRSQIEAAWGRPLQIRVYTGPVVDAALAKMGAEGAARDDAIALSGRPSLLVVAHEVAHVLQALGMGGPGDAEAGADDFADQVASGGPATLTGSLAPGEVGLKSYAEQAAELYNDVVDAGSEAYDDVVEAGAEMGEDALIQIIRTASPMIADLIDSGPDAMLEEALEGGINDFFVNLCGMTPEALLGEFGDTLSALAGALQGDADSCAFLGSSLEGLNAFIEGFFASEEFGQLEEAIQTVFDAFMTPLTDLILAPAFEEVMAKMGERFGQVKQVADACMSAAETIQAASTTAWEWVVDYFGLEVGTGEGFSAWLMAKATEIWNTIAEQLEPLRAPLTVIGAVLTAASPFGIILLIKDGLVPLMNTIGWLTAHADDPNLIENAREEFGDTWLPALLEGLDALEKQLSSGLDPILGYLAELQEGLSALGGAIGEFTASLSSLVNDLTSTMTSIVAWFSATWQSITTGISDMTGAAYETVRPILSVLSALTFFVAGFPAASIAVVMGVGWPYLCPCLRVQILQVCLNAAVAAIDSVQLPGLLGMMQPAVRAFYEGLSARLATDEAGVLVAFDNLAGIISGTNPEFLIGFVGGLVVGVVEGIFDPLLLIWDILSLALQIQYWAACMAVGNVQAGLEAAKEMGDAALVSMTEDAKANMTPELMAKFAELAERLAPIGSALQANFMPALESLMAGENMTWEELEGHFGTLWAAISSGLAGQAESLANGLIDGLQNPDGVSGTAGYAMGWIIGTLLVQVVAACCSFGILEAVLGTSKAARAVIAVIDMTEEAIGAAFKVLGRFADDVMEMIGKLATTLGDMAKGALGEIFELALKGFDEVKRFIDEAIGLLFRKGDDVGEELIDAGGGLARHGDEVAEGGGDLARHGDDVNGPDGKPRDGELDEHGNPKDGDDLDEDGNKKKDGDEEDDTDEKRAARTAASTAWGNLRPYAAKDLRTSSELTAQLAGEDKSVLGAKISYGLETSGSSWSVEATASGDLDDLSATRSAGSGWIARDGATEYYGDDSAVTANEAMADRVLDELEEAWQELCDTVEGDEGGDLQVEASRLASAFDSELKYPELAIGVDVGTPDYDEAEVKVDVEIGPNTTNKSRTLDAEGGGISPEKRMEHFRGNSNGFAPVSTHSSWKTKDGEDLDHRFRDSEEGTKKLVPSSPEPFTSDHYMTTLDGATINGSKLTMTDGMKRTDLDSNRQKNKVAKVLGAYSYTLLNSEHAGEVYDAVGKARAPANLAERLDVYRGLEDTFKCRQVTVVPHPLTKPWVDEYRDKMRAGIVAAIGNDLNDFYLSVIKSSAFKDEPGLKGGVFEHWLATYYDEYNAAGIYIPISISGDKRTEIIADGFVGGNLEAVSDVLYDAKAYSADSGPDVKSMLGYKAAMAVQCLKKGDIEHPKAFNKVRFVVAHHDVADVWAQVILTYMDAGSWEIAVGNKVVYPTPKTATPPDLS